MLVVTRMLVHTSQQHGRQAVRMPPGCMLRGAWVRFADCLADTRGLPNPAAGWRAGGGGLDLLGPTRSELAEPALVCCPMCHVCAGRAQLADVAIEAREEAPAVIIVAPTFVRKVPGVH